MARANSTMLTEIYTKANGLTIRPKATVATRMQMEPTMKDSGTTTNNTATELNPGQTEPVTMELTSRAKRRVEVASRSQTGATMRVSSTPTRYQDTAIITGQTVNSTRESGLRTKWKARVFYAGKTESGTRVTS